MLARWRDELISLSLLWVAAAVFAYLFDGHHLDRSFIIYRIAQNLSAGYGFAYNPGEPPLLHAAVSPAYALLLSLASLLSGDLPRIANLISALSIAAGSYILFFLMYRAGLAEALIAAALYLLAPLLWIALGLDVSLWMALALLSIYLTVREQPIPAALSLALCVLVRPEGILLAAVVAMDFLASSRPFRAWGLGIFVTALSIGWIWMFATFGGIGPAPGASASQFMPLPPDTAGPDALRGLAAVASTLYDFSPLWIVLPLLSIVGATRLREQRWAFIMVTWAALHLLILTALGVPIYAWNLAPLLPALSVLCALGIVWVASRIKVERISLGVGAALALLVTSVFAATLLGLAVESPLDGSKRDALHPARVEPAYQQAGRWIRENTVPEVRVGAMQPGLLGYESHRTLLDFDGNLHPAQDTVNILAPGDTFSWVAHQLPEILVLRASEAHSLGNFNLAADPWFAEAYAEVTRIATSTDLSDPLIIYRREINLPEIGDVREGYVEISGDLTLNHIGTDFSLAPLASGRRGLVTLEWVVGPGIDGVRVVTIRIQSLGGYLVAQNSRMLDFTGWPTNKLITSYHWVELSPVVVPGAYNIDVGVGRSAVEPDWHTVAHAKLPFEDTVFLGAFSGAQVQFGNVALVGYRLAQTAEGVDILLLWQAIETPRVEYHVLAGVRTDRKS